MPLIPSFSKDKQVDKSLGHSIKDGVAYSVMTGSAESYFSAFAIFLKASTQQVTLLASLPPLLASFSQLAAVYLGQKTGARKELIVAGAIIQLSALACVAIFPVLFKEYSFVLLLGFVVLYFIGPNLGSPLWGSLMGAIVPENVRGRFFGARTKLSSVASFSSLIIAGLVLQFFDSLALTYYGFACIYSLGVVARGISAWQLSQLHDPPHTNSIPGDVSNLFSAGFFKGQSRFLKFSVFYGCMQGAVAISGPLIVIYLLKVLEFSYIELTINTAASVLVQFLVLNRWGRLSDLFGNRIILRLTGFIIPVVPLLWVLSTDFYYLLLVQAISGLLWSGFTLSASNFVYDSTSQNKRAGLMAVHALLAASSVFAGAIFGGWLSVHLPTEITIFGQSFSWLTSIYCAFLISTLFRLIVAFSFLPRLQEVRDVKSMSYHGLFFRVTRFSPISGVIFEVISRRKKGDYEGL